MTNGITDEQFITLLSNSITKAYLYLTDTSKMRNVACSPIAVVFNRDPLIQRLKEESKEEGRALGFGGPNLLESWAPYGFLDEAPIVGLDLSQNSFVLGGTPKVGIVQPDEIYSIFDFYPNICFSDPKLGQFTIQHMIKVGIDLLHLNQPVIQRILECIE